tara:strand:+ start:7490 stop:8410 length:921 start_codon:yes stop_codon:yes gene_type:complete
MLANFFGKSNPANFIIIFLIFIAFFCAISISSNLQGTINFSFIFHQLSILILFSFLFFCYNFILSKNKLTLYNSYGFLLFVLFFGFYPDTMTDRNGVILNLIVLVFLRKVFSLSSLKSPYKKMVDSGFWLGILFLMEPSNLIFAILIFISIGLFQKLNIRTFLIPIIGFLAPVFCYFSYCFWFENIEEFTKLFLWESNYKIQITKPISFSSIFLGSLIFISIFLKTPKVLLIRGMYRKYWILIIFNMILAISIFLIQKDYSGFERILLFFPASIIITNWMESIKNIFLKNILICLLIIIPVILLIV